MLRTAFGAMSKDLFEGAKMDIMEAETESVPLVNPATGKPVIIRRFEYDVPPYTIDWPTEEEIRYIHQKSIEKFLYKDELKLFDELRVIIHKDKNKFEIFAPCEPLTSSYIVEKPHTLQEIIKPTKKNDNSRGHSK